MMSIETATHQLYTFGNAELLKLPKTAFLSSQRVPASSILKCFDWAIASRENGDCVMSGFHSKIEKDVLHYLSKGNQPIIIVLARGLRRRTETFIQKLVDSGRCLLISPFDECVKKITRQTCLRRNELMINIADKVIIGYAGRGGQVDRLLPTCSKPVEFL